MLAVAVLGVTELRIDGALAHLPSGKVPELLARLAVAAGAPVTADRLIEDLWDTHAAAAARNTLQSKVSALRRAGAVVAVAGGGYRLEVDPNDVDALRAVASVARAEQHLDDGRWPQARDTAAAAAALFRGEPFADASDRPWARVWREQLAETRLRLAEVELTARLHAGGAADIVAPIQALAAEHPLRESLWSLLVKALYRAGRQSDALAALQQVRDLLADQLGVDPSPDLQALQRQILAQDPALLAVRSPAPVAVRPVPPAGPGPRADALLGRDEEVATVRDRLATFRLVTLTGPAGVGKTRLAMHLAGLPVEDGGTQREVWAVRLESTASGQRVPETVGDSLGMAGATPAALRERLTGADALLLLDNCEHVSDAVAELVESLLPVAPRIRVLATSQVPLRVTGECVVQLEPLPPDAAASLFRQRAREHRRGRDVDAARISGAGADHAETDHAETDHAGADRQGADDAVEALCRALDGLPLAIELAAARTKVLSVEDIARRLDDRFSLLTDPGTTPGRRHRALSTAIGWSYDLLFPDDQRGLWALACFAGDAGLEAFEAVTVALGVPREAALDVVDRLVDRSLVHTVTVGGRVRYRLLDSVRAYARDRMRDAGEQDAAEAAHAAWYAALADAARSGQQGPGQAAHLTVAMTERSNLDAAVTWAARHDPALGLRIAAGFGWASVVLGQGGAGAERLRRAVSAAGDRVPVPAVAYALALAAWNEAGGDVTRARSDAQRALELAARAGDPAVTALAVFASAFAALQSGEPATALESLARLRGELDVAPDADLPDGDGAPPPSSAWLVVMHAVLTGLAALAIGDVDLAASGVAAARPVLAAVGDPWLTSHVDGLSGQVALARHELAPAVAHLRSAADAAGAGGTAATQSFHLLALGRALELAGDAPAATAALTAAVDAALGVGLMRLVALSRVSLGRLQRRLGDPLSARATLVQAHTWFAGAGGGDQAPMAEAALVALDLADRGPVAGADGDRTALHRLTELLAAARAGGDAGTAVVCLDAIAAAHALAGEAAAATDLLRDADAVAAAAGIPAEDRVDADRARSLLTP